MAAPEPPGEQRRGRYVLGPRLGVGEVAEVYLAELEGEGGFRRKLVLKCLRGDLAHRPEQVRMFLDEASLVAGLRHPNIVQVLDLARDGSTYFMALELVDGPSLANLLGYTMGVGLTLPIEIGLHVIIEAARGLHFAHEADRGDGEPLGVVHRDVRPANVLISRLGEVKVADFSIALSSASRWSAAQRIHGGPGYVAPEQEALGEVDRRSDIFSLGVILWELAVGRRLYPHHDERRAARGRVPPPSAFSAAIDERLDAIIARATSTDAAARQPSAEALADELSEWLVRSGRRAGRVELARWLRDSCPDLGPAGLRPLAVASHGSLERAPSEPPPPREKIALPERPGTVVGRDAELAAMDAAVARGVRLIALSGPGGVGKTRVALEWAHRVRGLTGGRAVFCDAQHAKTAADVAHLVIAQLAPSTVQPRASRDPVASARDLLTSGGPIVVVLDQIDALDDPAALFEAWLADALETFYVATSRAPLAVEGAESIPLRPLSMDRSSPAGPAAELFFARLEEAGGREAVARWRDPARAAQVKQVLDRLEGLPLAIVVTAARAAEETPSEMARAAAGPGRMRAPTEVTEAALRDAWSGCGPEERAALLQCTAFFGPFTFVAASSVLRIGGDVKRALDALVDKSLLEIEGGKLRMHQSVRELSRAITPPLEIDEARARHARYVLATSEELLRGVRGPGAGRAFALLEAMEPELRGIHAHALARGEGEISLRAALCLEPTLARRGDHRNLITLLQLAVASGASPASSARGAMAEARAHGWLFDFQPALDAATRALAFAAAADAKDLLAEARSELAMVEVRCGQGEDAAKRYRDALTAMREAGDRRGEGVVLLRLANLLSERGETQAATMMYRVALEAIREARDRVYEGIILSNLGAQLLDDGRPDQAHQALYLSEEIFRELGEERYGAVSRGLIGLSVALQGNWEQGSEAVERSLETLRRIGERGIVVFLVGVLVSARARLGDEEKARWWVAHMDALGDALTGTPVEHISAVRHGHIELLEARRAVSEGRHDEARALIAVARRRASEAPRDVLTTLRIAAADLWAHCDEVESELFPDRRRRASSIGRLRLTKRTLTEE